MADRLRDDKGFGTAIANAAEGLGRDPGFVEKDYWVTQVLRALTDRYSASVVFKGGTSLSKGYGIINRFSEDVDILVRPKDALSIKNGEQRLLEITEHVAAELGVPWEPKRNPSRGRNASRADVLRYPQTIEPAVEVPIERDGVLLETGYGDGREPARIVEITPMLCEPLGIDPNEFSDTRPFDIAALDPLRTLLEKVVLLHHVASTFDGEGMDQRIGRHYHDVDRLLAHQPTLNQLRDGPDDVKNLITDIERISEAQYGGSTPRPKAGFGAGPAFSPEPGTELRAWLKERYDAAEALMPDARKWPKFETVLNRIGKHSDLF